MSQSQQQRAHDVVLYGATGFTGRQSARYFREHAPNQLRWAIAGRNVEKLRQLHASLELGSQVAILVADSADQPALDAIAASCHVLLTTAGPFARYGDGVVRACVTHGTHYVDITGETAWVRRMIDTWHDQAAAQGTRIVPFCGFDSIPSDLGVWMMAQWFRAQGHGEVKNVRASFKLGGGGLNGGTLASGLHAGESGDQATLGDVLLLNPTHRRTSAEAKRSRDWRVVEFDDTLQTYLTPFVMAPVNTRVVRRSNALLADDAQPYGESFTYTECMETSRRGAAYGTLYAMGALQGLLTRKTGRALLRRFGPAPGAGPTEEQMDRGWFRLRLVAEAEDGTRALGVVTGQGDAGNRSTVRMLCESAITLAVAGDALPGGVGAGGVLTPATGIGAPLLKRLRATAEMTWEVSPLEDRLV